MFSLEYLRQFRIGTFTIFDTFSAYLGIFLLSPILVWLFSKVNLKIDKQGNKIWDKTIGGSRTDLFHNYHKMIEAENWMSKDQGTWLIFPSNIFLIISK